jgi:hypothetical protein
MHVNFTRISLVVIFRFLGLVSFSFTNKSVRYRYMRLTCFIFNAFLTLHFFCFLTTNRNILSSGIFILLMYVRVLWKRLCDF